MTHALINPPDLQPDANGEYPARWYVGTDGKGNLCWQFTYLDVDPTTLPNFEAYDDGDGGAPLDVLRRALVRVLASFPAHVALRAAWALVIVAGLVAGF